VSKEERSLNIGIEGFKLLCEARSDIREIAGALYNISGQIANLELALRAQKRDKIISIIGKVIDTALIISLGFFIIKIFHS
jgi:hypothetical protein